MAAIPDRLQYFRYRLFEYLVGEKKFQVPRVLAITAWLHIFLIFLFGVGGYALAGFWRTQKQVRKVWQDALLVGVSLLYGLGIFSTIDLWFRYVTPERFTFWSIFSVLSIWYLILTPFFPWGYIVLEAWDMVKDMFRPITAEVALERQQRELQKHQSYIDNKNSKLSEPQVARDFLTLGVKLKGDNFPSHIGIENHNGWIGLENKLLNQHMFVLGTTGAGKTQALLRIIKEVLSNTDRDIYIVDGKGDLEFAMQIASLAYHIKGIKVPIFKMGHDQDGAWYNGFVGNNQSIYNRLALMLGLQKTDNAGQEWYGSGKSQILQLVCGVGHRSLNIEPPRNFDELLDRLSMGWLLETYKSIPREIRAIKEADKDGDLAGTYKQLSVLARSLGEIVNESGFILEETQVAVFSIRTQSVTVEGKKYLDFSVEDWKDYIGKRQKQGRTALFIIDEFGNFENQNIVSVLSLARGAGVGCILATQDASTLGDPILKQRILSNCNTYFLMKTNFPEEVASLAGTVMRIEASSQILDGEIAEKGTARTQHQFAIDMNDVAQLKPGEMYLINSRKMAKLRVKQVENIELTEDAVQPNPKTRLYDPTKEFLKKELEKQKAPIVRQDDSGIV